MSIQYVGLAECCPEEDEWFMPYSPVCGVNGITYSNWDMAYCMTRRGV